MSFPSDLTFDFVILIIIVKNDSFYSYFFHNPLPACASDPVILKVPLMCVNSVRLGIIQPDDGLSVKLKHAAMVKNISCV
jgi:hypothetical protein